MSTSPVPNGSPRTANHAVGAATTAEGEVPSSVRAGLEFTEAEPPLGLPAGTLACRPAVHTVREFLDHLLESRLLSAKDLEKFLAEQRDLGDNEVTRLADGLVDQGLLTPYQVGRLRAGQTFGLVLGNYRIVERLGAGGMGVVYKAEHLYMKRTVAIKVLVTEEASDSLFLHRFYSEMQATAVLNHPNIVQAFDAGEIPVPQAPRAVLRYLAMEFVPGKTLEQHVLDHGPLPFVQACQYIRQAAQGLQHAHERGLVHRDIKPSNLLLTPADQVKILDFGLARVCRRRHTEAYALLGTIDYIAPEQARDARSVDIRADIYGLGGTFYWLLTGQKPFPSDRPVLEELMARQREAPTPLRRTRPDLPAELEALVRHMMAHDPKDRYATPQAVITALTAFLEGRLRGNADGGCDPNALPPGAIAPAQAATLSARPVRRVLVVSERLRLRELCRGALEAHGLECVEVPRPELVAELLTRFACDVLLLDADLPNHDGLKLCLHLRTEPPAPHLKVALVTPENSAELLAAGQKVGADDLIPETVSPRELAGRVRTLLRVKEAEERADCLAGHLLTTNQQLEQALNFRDVDLYQAQDVLIFAMAKMAELRGLETGTHLLRMQSYVRVLAEEAAQLPAFQGQIDGAFVRMLERCVLLHDIGKVALPDHILLKPGKLDAEERVIMESHAGIGADLLAAVAKQHGAALAFLQMASDIVRHHHERYDGSGYPDGLAGEAIPLAARIVMLTDVYDALRSKLVYKPGLAHGAAKRLLLEASPGQFDPALLIAFRRCEASFEQIFAQLKD